jgi:hypothetical protein
MRPGSSGCRAAATGAALAAALTACAGGSPRSAPARPETAIPSAGITQDPNPAGGSTPSKAFSPVLPMACTLVDLKALASLFGSTQTWRAVTDDATLVSGDMKAFQLDKVCAFAPRNEPFAPYGPNNYVTLSQALTRPALESVDGTRLKSAPDGDHPPISLGDEGWYDRKAPATGAFRVGDRWFSVWVRKATSSGDFDTNGSAALLQGAGDILVQAVRQAAARVG